MTSLLFYKVGIKIPLGIFLNKNVPFFDGWVVFQTALDKIDNLFPWDLERELYSQLERILSREESYWNQKSRKN